MIELAMASAVAIFGSDYSSEKLEYDVYWFLINAGQAKISAETVKDEGGRELFHFAIQAESQLLFFFKVNDRVESWCQVQDFSPVKFEKHLREGGYRKDQVVLFDGLAGTARYGEEEAKVGGCRDILGAFYYFRQTDWPELGGEVSVCVHADKENYPMVVKFVERAEVLVSAGKFKTVVLKIVPDPKFEGLFRHKGDIWVWLTDDEERTPVKVMASLPILGSVRAELKQKTRQ